MIPKYTEKPIRISRSFVSARYLGEVIADTYDVGPVAHCKLFSKLLRTQDNDQYLVEMETGERLVARVYQNGDNLGRQASDYLFELEWLLHLHAEGCRVSYPLTRRDGGYLGWLDAPEGPRYFALFHMVQGKALLPTNEEQLFAFGAGMAQIHQASATFKTEQERILNDFDFLIDKPVERIKNFWGKGRMEELEELVDTAVSLKTRLRAVLGARGRAGNSWGVIGGDFHADNVRFNAQNVPGFFNFDLCGHGWRAYDIAVFLENTPEVYESVELSEAFFAGYYSVRPLAENEHEAIPLFMSVRRIWLMGSFAVDRGLAGHTFIGPA